MNTSPVSAGPAVLLNQYRVSAPGQARVVSNTRLTPDGADDVRHIVLDLDGLEYRFQEGQSLGILTPGVNERGQPHKLRLYSIASTRLGDDGLGRSASLCVKRVVYLDPETGEERRGLASNYLCDVKPGDEVFVTGPSGKTFLLPEDPQANLILVATGTGIAPFRAFLRRIFLESSGWRGQVYLIFGVRTAAECLYRDELESLKDRPNFHLLTAFSREQTSAAGKRLYVQDRIHERIDEFWNLLAKEHSFLYICGLKGMETGIKAVLETYSDGPSPTWTETSKRLMESGRSLVETY